MPAGGAGRLYCKHYP